MGAGTSTSTSSYCLDLAFSLWHLMVTVLSAEAGVWWFFRAVFGVQIDSKLSILLSLVVLTLLGELQSRMVVLDADSGWCLTLLGLAWGVDTRSDTEWMLLPPPVHSGPKIPV